ncbi:hypothetical protein F2Q69_00005015 [Brassica cretica]|uniref:Uncharacterized protein n=1 Tax=Brassica cretica TaxID=69181 RepID=A0A8S9NY29_BRACR|nr:hypothetical protein F2Q69_00005015 [Brassica cretica]
MNLELGRNASWTRAGLDANGLRLEMRAADRRTGAVAVGIAIASGFDANGKLCYLERGYELEQTRGRIKVCWVRIRVPKQIGAHCICA